MAGSTFHVEIVTPQEKVFEGEVASVTVPGSVGPFQVLVNHAPIVTELEVGDIKVVNGGGEEFYFATSGGFAEMRNNRLSVISDSVETASAIDIQRAESSRIRASERIAAGRAHTEQVDIARAEAALARATNRLRVAGKFGR